eukprot:CAMPEP_0168733574 /NCGR_PEP_ID=MMETSP0724-20121128/8364_1 /TAXON_ID=265536 /ORGANISM="Amphiprora sp., Strain CCMP467" /LENGTH=450 /DNA_ID=CAMNT_0008780643 /DNA_START=142 /DNA_END=1494 /DNA_ORIENTATION=+
MTSYPAMAMLLLWLATSISPPSPFVVQAFSVNNLAVCKIWHAQQQRTTRESVRLHSTATPSSSSLNDDTVATPRPQQQQQQDDDDEPLPDVAFQSIPLITFAGQVEQALKDTYGESNVERVLQMWRMLNADYQYKRSVRHLLDDDDDCNEDTDSDTSHSFRTQVCNSYLPGLPVREFWYDTTTQQDADNDKHDDPFAWATQLRAKFPAIQREFQTFVTAPRIEQEQQGNNIWSGALTADAASYGVGWKTLVLQDRGQWDAVNCQLFPTTAQALRDCGAPTTEVFFASMAPHSEIQPHSDFTNFVLTSHLALDIPTTTDNGKVELRIGDTTRPWVNGHVNVFDTSLMHSAVNEADQTRYILMMRLWHPHLTDTERSALQFLYDVLDDSDNVLAQALVSPYPHQRERALELAAARREFPQLPKRVGRTVGFGGAGGTKKSVSKKKKPKRNKK